MNASVAGHFGVKGRGKHAALPHRDDVPGCLGQYLYAVTDPLYPRRADEHRVHRLVEATEPDVALKRVDLTSKSVAPHGDIDGLQWNGLATARAGVQNLTGQQDHSRAG